MIRDPFYLEIISRLNKKLDPELFERCVVDLLKAYYPTIVPVRGGCDRGMDGAISDGKGPPYPLVSTTKKDVIGNLTQSLNSYLKEDGQRRRVLVATPQELTSTRRSNLEKRAIELGFTLIQTYTQSAIADLLYHSPKWCQELLNLTGDPPPLSVQPITRRLLIGKSLIARKNYFTWLKDSQGDLLLVGVPGSGKTFLFHKFAKDGFGFFVISKDKAKIASGIRSQQPKALLIDDAHLNLNLIGKLVHLRSELRANYRIIANSWPGQQDEVVDALNISGPSIRRLELLTRDQIVDVIKSTGIVGPNQLVRELVDQADGKPGLAVTLCYLCLNDSLKEVALGDALYRDVRTTFKQLLGHKAISILASFALGGDQGMLMTDVAKSLGLTTLKVREVVTRLAAGGVLDETGNDTLSVRPVPLRFALVRDTFFCGATSLPSDDLINQAVNINDATFTLIGSISRGATIPKNKIESFVERCQSSDVWKAYCSLGTSECNWVLEKYSDKLISIADVALKIIPKKVIPMLLNEAIGDDRELEPNPQYPLRLIKDWAKAGEPDSGEAIKRRNILLESVESWGSLKQESKIVLQSLQFVISPKFEILKSDPGSDSRFALLGGSVTFEEMLDIQLLWPRAIDIIKHSDIEDFKPIVEMISSWAYPHFFKGNISEKHIKNMHSFAIKMIKDSILIFKNHPAFLHWAKKVSKDLDQKINVSLDAQFEILYPEERFDNWEEWGKEEIAAATDLSKVWSKGPPDLIINKLIYFEQEAKSVGISYPRLSPFVCDKMAESISSPEVWAKLLINKNADGDLIAPFLKQILALDSPEKEAILEICIRKHSLLSSILPLIITIPNVPDKIFKKLMAILDKKFSKQIEFICRQNKIYDNRIVDLLSHGDRYIAGSAAVGEWYHDSRGIIHKSHKSLWRKAIINFIDIGYSAKSIFGADPSIACDWIEARINESSDLFRIDNIIEMAINTLEIEHRQYLINRIPENFWYQSIIKNLVGKNIVLFKDLLNNERCKDFHLLLLQEYPDEKWVEKVLICLNVGYSHEDVVKATFAIGKDLSSDGWVKRYQQFERLSSHSDSRIQIITQLCKEQALEYHKRASDFEKQITTNS